MGFLQIHTPSYIFIPLTKKMGYEFVSCQSLGYEFVSYHFLGYENVRYHQHVSSSPHGGPATSLRGPYGALFRSK